MILLTNQFHPFPFFFLHIDINLGLIFMYVFLLSFWYVKLRKFCRNVCAKHNGGIIVQRKRYQCLCNVALHLVSLVVICSGLY